MKAAILGTIGLGLALAGCSGKRENESGVVVVLAASSLKNPLDALVKGLGPIDPDLKIRVSYAGSQDLVAQVAAGAPAEVFCSAGETAIKQLVEKGLVESGQVKPFARNRLAVAFGSKVTPPLKRVDDLARPGLKLVIGAESVPIGRFARDFLSNLEKATPGIQAKILANVASFEQSDLALLAKVKLGEADAAIVYASDLATDGKLSALEIPSDLNVTAMYFAAPLKGARNPVGAKRFIERLMAPKMGQMVLVECGFLAASPAEYWSDDKKEG